MLENPTPTAPPADTATVKRYAPPNQRNRSHNRRKSGERNQLAVSRNTPANAMGHGDAGTRNLLSENSRPRLITLEGCSSSEASQLLNDQAASSNAGWAAAMNSYNDPSIDLSERPVLYSGSGAPAWGHFRLPHQFMAPPSIGASVPHMDFLSELRHAMHNVNSET